MQAAVQTTPAATTIATAPAAHFGTVEQLTAHCSIGYFTSGQMDRSIHNVRPAAADIKANVRELAQLIAHQGLLQNLVGYVDVDGRVKIVAGERRRNAILLNIEEGVLPEDYLIPVLLITEAEAVAVSLAENSGRQGMHHADVSAAMLQLRTNGASVADIAMCFGVDELVVRRRLKLANLSPVIFQHYRQDELSFEQVIAYALVDDHAQQEAVLAVVGLRGQPWSIREKLTDQKINLGNRIAKFVGIEAFEAAGGVIERDLFSDKGDGFITDGALLEQLALAKMEPEAEKLRAQGYAWVEVTLQQMGWSELEQYATARLTRREPTDEETAALVAITKEEDDVQAKIEKLEEQLNDAEEPDEQAEDELTKLQERLDELTDTHVGLENQLSVPVEEDKPLTGAVVYIGYNSTLEIKAGIIKPEDKKKMSKATTGGATASGTDQTKAKAIHSEALMLNLTSHRTLALRAELMEQPGIALVLVTHRLMCRAFDMQMHSWDNNSASSLTWTTAMLDKDAETGKAGAALAARRAEIAALLPNKVNAQKLLPWLLEQDQATVWKMFAYCTALSFDLTARKEPDEKKHFPVLAKVLKLDMANWWTAGEDYFGRVSIGRIVDVVKGASKEVAARIEKMKKRDAVTAAVDTMKDKRWLPEILSN